MSLSVTRRGLLELLVAVTILILISGCSDELTSPDLRPVDPAGASFAASGGRVVEQASGSGHFRDDQSKRTFTFKARERLDGTTTGSFGVVIQSAAGTRQPLRHSRTTREQSGARRSRSSVIQGSCTGILASACARMTHGFPLSRE